MAKSHERVLTLLDKLRSRGIKVEQSPVIKNNVYVLGGANHLLVRSSKFFRNRGYYFFGLTKDVFDNFAKIPGSFLAFIGDDPESCFVVPTKMIASVTKFLSHTPNQYKLMIGNGFLLLPKGSGAPPLDLRPYIGKFDQLSEPVPQKPLDSDRPAFAHHGEIQGMLLEVGNMRGYNTYAADKSPKYRGKPLHDIATLHTLPPVAGVSSDVAGKVDVLWFQDDFPTHAFEIELSTGIWTGLVRLGEFARLSTRLHVVTRESRIQFEKRIQAYVFRMLIDRCTHATVSEIKKLHGLQTELSELNQRVGL
ncbi:MAG: hypothetical protein AB1696_26090 [Planctomycetota bacterium]